MADMSSTIDRVPVLIRAQWLVIGRTALLVVTVISILFPYVQIIPLGSYTQPYALILGLLVLLTSRFSSVSRMSWVDTTALISFAVLGVGLFALGCAPYRNVQEYKYLLNYLSPLILTLACFTLLDWNKRLVGQLVSGAIVVWFWVAMAQALLNARFMTFLLGEWEGAAGDIAASGRGVIGLSPEPTHHAFHMLILGGCAVLLKQPRWTIVLCAISAVLLARSASGALVLGLAVGIALIVYRPRTVILLGTLLLGAAILGAGNALLTMAEGNRLLTLLGNSLNNPVGPIIDDYSTNIRVGGAIAGFLNSAEFGFFPHGLSFESWAAARLDIIEQFSFLKDISTTGVPSGYGVLIFQAGVLAFPFLWIWSMRMVTAKVEPFSRVFVFAVPLVFLFQYYISAPQFALAYACAIYLWQHETTV